jgi:hypothetical protein
MEAIKIKESTSKQEIRDYPEHVLEGVKESLPFPSPCIATGCRANQRIAMTKFL